MHFPMKDTWKTDCKNTVCGHAHHSCRGQNNNACSFSHLPVGSIPLTHVGYLYKIDIRDTAAVISGCTVGYVPALHFRRGKGAGGAVARLLGTILGVVGLWPLPSLVTTGLLKFRKGANRRGLAVLRGFGVVLCFLAVVLTNAIFPGFHYCC